MISNMPLLTPEPGAHLEHGYLPAENSGTLDVQQAGQDGTEVWSHPLRHSGGSHIPRAMKA